MVGGSKIKIKHEHLFYRLMGKPGIFYRNIKIIQYIVIIILIILFYIVWNSVTNFQYRLLKEMHDLPCSPFKVSHHVVSQNNFARGTLGHAIEHGQVKGSHMTLNVQHESSFNLLYGATMCYGRAT